MSEHDPGVGDRGPAPADLRRVAGQYAEFSVAFRGDSPCFETWARAVSEDSDVQAWIARLPRGKQQPTLVFAAARWHGVTAPGPYAGLRSALLGDDGTIRATVLSRSTQTNEVGRLATLVPVFARIAAESGRPLALVEVGASAGLCLRPDGYRYRWVSDDGRVSWAWPRFDDALPELTCHVTGPFRPPLDARPKIAWRVGLDIHPLDVADEDEMAWLATLVWPEQEERRARLRYAVDVARHEPVTVLRGDLRTDVGDLVERARAHGEVVVFHTAVAAYLRRSEREAFHDQMMDLTDAGACRWVSQEHASILPRVTATGPEVPEGASVFVLGLDGRALAWTHGHGSGMTWLRSE